VTDARELHDVEEFLRVLSAPEIRTRFAGGDDVFITRAPGRLDVMGGIADYSGSLVLQLPLAEATLVALQRDPERVLRIESPSPDGSRSSELEMPLKELERDGAPLAYAEACAYFQERPRNHWASYVAGAFLVLMRERGIRFAEGARLLIRSRVPEGKGVSSSAALEVAVMQAVCAAFAVHLRPTELALLCQKVENLVAGAPCGVMDQMTAACGEAGKLLALLCRPCELRGHVAIPEGIAFMGIDSGVRHAVSGSDYGSVRVGAFMGHRILSERREFVHLAEWMPDDPELELPERMLGREFLERYGATADTVTRVDPEPSYAVQVPTLHPVHEHARVERFAELLRNPVSETQLRELGELMLASHASYSDCGLGTPQTDSLVELAQQQGLYGAKITGGGSGGTVAVLGRSDKISQAVAGVADAYAGEWGQQPTLFAGSSPGAAAFGQLRVARAVLDRSGSMLGE
jgi:L-arabinokinase